MNDKAKQLTLYSRAECHLCDQAEALVTPIIQHGQWQLVKVDIDSDPDLLEKYGFSIPVLLRNDNGQSLNWPFPPSRVKTLLDN
jgi:thioredoxin-like negative regulator of GroEL